MVAVPLMSAGPSVKNLTFWVTSLVLCHSCVPFWITEVCSSLLRVMGLLSGPAAHSDSLAIGSGSLYSSGEATEMWLSELSSFSGSGVRLGLSRVPSLMLLGLMM